MLYDQCEHTKDMINDGIHISHLHDLGQKEWKAFMAMFFF